MDRPTRGAAQRARQLISSGFRLKEYEEVENNGLTAEEEDEIDEELFGEKDFDESTAVEEEIADGAARHDDDTSQWFSYDDEDIDIDVKEFMPCRPPGPHLGERLTRLGAGGFTKAIHFFQLFFTEELMKMLCDHTNLYAWLNIFEKPSYAKKNDGSWQQVDEEEMERFIALIIMMGFIVLPDIARYWSQKSLYSGGLAARFMGRNRFKALLAMMHVSNPNEEDRTDKLAKVRLLLDHMKSRCLSLYQPRRQISIDERMVCSKARSGIRQFMPNKPVRFGYKLWCLCESGTGYTIDFNIYTGKREHPSINGLAYDDVCTLLSKFQNQYYAVFMDNFYTSTALCKSLLQNKVYACGTTLARRKGYPTVLKDKKWEKRAKRGDMRYKRDDDVVCLQWKDNKTVNVCSTCHRGNEYTFVQRRVKDTDGSFRKVMVRKPKAIHDYNTYMGGVDLADQMIQSYNVLLKSVCWWKTIFFHMIDVAVLNSYILFKQWQKMHPEIPELQRPPTYSHLDFCEELVRQLGKISESEVPLPGPATTHPSNPAAIYHTDHLPDYSEIRRNCRVCYLNDQREVKTNWQCSHPACGVYLCINKERNCMRTWHLPEFDHIREAKFKHVH